MAGEGILTEFAPAPRAGQQDLDRQVQLFAQAPHLRGHFDAVPSVVLIVNEQRQIVFANQAAATTLDSQNKDALYGLRPGEALGCIHAHETDSGCGTTSFCGECGAVRAILASLDGGQSVEECRVTSKDGAKTFDFRVFSSPYEYDGERFVVFVVNDISHEKRRQVLERVFFHDVANTLTLLSAYTSLMPGESPQEEEELAEKLEAVVRMLVNEVEAQRGLLQAEDGELRLKPFTMCSLEFLSGMVSMYRHHSSAKDKAIVIDAGAEDVEFVSDRTQLSRVLENMLKNALEASSPGEAVRAGCGPADDGRVCFWVANNQHIPPKAQLQIFNRSFTTKGMGRGIGTYSMKLLAERYLKGEVTFTSSPEAGTVFTAILPRTI